MSFIHLCGLSHASNSWRLSPSTPRRKFFGATWLKQPDRTKPIADFGLTVSLDFFRLLGDERFEILQQKTLGGHEPIHVFCPTDSQVSFEEDSIKTGYRSGNFLCMLINKLVHGVLPDGVVAQLPH
jgi:hypothetical protein